MRTKLHIAALALLATILLGPVIAVGGNERPTLIAELLREVNIRRELSGKQPVRLNRLLTAAAQKHAQDMSENFFFDHLSPDGRGVVERVTAQGYPWRVIAENIGAGLSSPNSMVAAWMNSRDHRANLLSGEFNDVGIGYSQLIKSERKLSHSYYWVLVFGARYK